MKSIAVLGAFDTKGAELAYLIDCIHALAPLADVISVDVSARAHEAVFSATIPNVAERWRPSHRATGWRLSP